MNPTLDSLSQCLKQEDALVREFTAILEAENGLLVERRPVEELQAMSESKAVVAGKLVSLSDRRDELLAELGLPAGYTGTHQAATTHPELLETWEALLAKSNAANDMNARNGALIDVHLRYTQQALDALNSMAGTRNATGYDASGRSARPAVGRRTFIAT